MDHLGRRARSPLSLAAPAVFGSGRAVIRAVVLVVLCEARDLARGIVPRCERTRQAARAGGRGAPGAGRQGAYSSMRLRVRVESTLMPGPIVVEMTMDFTYLPLAVEGFTRRSSLYSAE